jgi:hypothetical protein
MDSGLELYLDDHSEILWDVVDKLVKKNTVEKFDPSHRTPGFYSHIFLVTKKSSVDMRMIHNFNDLQWELIWKICQLLSLNELREIVKPQWTGWHQ